MSRFIKGNWPLLLIVGFIILISVVLINTNSFHSSGFSVGLAAGIAGGIH